MEIKSFPLNYATKTIFVGKISCSYKSLFKDKEKTDDER